MRLLALLLLVGVAQAQGLTTLAPGQTGQKRTNYVVQSNTMSTATAATSPWALGSALVVTVAGAPVGGGTWAEVTGAQAASAIQVASITGLPTYTTATASVYAAKASGTGPMTIQMGVTGWAPTCSCSRSDGGACTASVLSTHWCGAVATIGTDPVRVSVTGTGSASTASSIYLNTGDRTAANTSNTTRFAGAQLEVGVSKASKLCVTTTAARTCK